MHSYLSGYDTTVFDATLPTTTAIIRGETVEERAQQLAKSGRTASAGGMFRFLGSMLYNGEELLRAREIQRENKQKDLQDKEDKEQQEMETLFEEADQVYEKFIDHDSKLSALTNADLKKLIKFICKVERKPKDAPSHHNTADKMKKRLRECKIRWTKYFNPDSSEEEEAESDEEVEGKSDSD